MNQECIDNNIMIIANGLDRDIPEEEIIQAYMTAGFDQGDTFLLLTAAKIIHQDRKTAIKPKALFKRVE
jgi:hypothetical protein